MLKKVFWVRFSLTLGLILSIIFAIYSIYYKINFLDFSFAPQKKTPVWTIEAHLNFVPLDEKIKIVFSKPNPNDNFKILDENIIAKGYTISETDDDYIITSDKKEKKQNLYYRISIYDMNPHQNLMKEETPQSIQQPILDDEMMRLAQELLTLSKQESGDRIQQIISILNQDTPNELVKSFIPERANLKEKAERLIDLLALDGVSAKLIRGIKLIEGKKSVSADVMIEVYDNDNKEWIIYDIETGNKGLPENFVAFQRGKNTLVDVSGGKDSVIKYSVLKSLNSSFNMAKYRAKNAHKEAFFNCSIYNLPIEQQNALKWLMVFPLAIFMIVLLRNVVGIKTMGTFTPMLISMALVETGFVAGLVCFSIIVGIGLVIRFLLSRLNLLLVPRISAVVVFVILIIQICSIVGYRMDWSIASSALFFPIIILAWIIERASIIWEEEGLKNSIKEVFFSLVAAVIIYFVIVDENIRHVMFVFNELNLVILFLIMLLGTYTGYRLTELRRFAPLIHKVNKKSNKGK